jgi:hypothetical protein
MHRGFDAAPHPDTGETDQEVRDFEQVTRQRGAVAVGAEMTPAQRADWSRIVPETPVD